MCVVNILTMSAQLVLPEALRARGMAIYQMAIMGGTAMGALIWGTLADLTSVPVSLAVCAGSLLVALAFTRIACSKAGRRRTTRRRIPGRSRCRRRRSRSTRGR